MDLPKEGATLAGRYRLLRTIGSGGMGMVYEAEHLRLRHRVAIKLLHPQLAARAELVARFEREARSATQLTSPHVARVTDVDVTAEGAPFMVMELLQGQDLSRELAQNGPLPIATAVSYVLQACDAMIEAHSHGIVHRDLKPANLFLADAGGRRTVKVLDFGISKVATDEDEPGLTSTFSALGTALYMSPEQVRSAKRVDARSDIWSLGVILYEALAGRTPFEGESVTSVAASIVADPVPSVRSVRTDVPESLDAVVDQALTKDRDKRFQSMVIFAEALAQFGPETSRPSLPQIHEALASPSIRIEHPLPALAATPNTAPGWSQASPSMRHGRPRWLVPALIGSGAVLLVALALGLSSALSTPTAPHAGSSSAPVTNTVAAPTKDPTRHEQKLETETPSASSSAPPPTPIATQPRRKPRSTKTEPAKTAAPKPTGNPDRL